MRGSVSPARASAGERSCAGLACQPVCCQAGRAKMDQVNECLPGVPTPLKIHVPIRVFNKCMSHTILPLIYSPAEVTNLLSDGFRAGGMLGAEARKTAGSLPPTSGEAGISPYVAICCHMSPYVAICCHIAVWRTGSVPGPEAPARPLVVRAASASRLRCLSSCFSACAMGAIASQ